MPRANQDDESQPGKLDQRGVPPAPATGPTHRKPRQRPRADGGRPWRNELRQSSTGPIQLPPRSLLTFPCLWFIGFGWIASGLA